MSELDWLAGFLDACGCFTKNKLKIVRKTENRLKIYRYQNPVLFVVNNDPSPLEIVRRMIGGGKIIRIGGSYRLEVRRKQDVLRVVELIDGRLRSFKKKEVFEKWKWLVFQWKQRSTRIH